MRDNAFGGSSLDSTKRMFDVVVALVLLLLLAPALIVVAVLIRLTSKGPAVYWSSRVGRNNVLFQMPKFRSMHVDTPQVATHLLTSSTSFLTPIGGFLRKFSLDELPQLWSILRGDISFVGPRPALFNQDDLVALRTSCGVHTLVPGLTGWAQVNGRDDLSISEKVRFDEEYLLRRSFAFDCTIIGRTFTNVLRSRGVHH